MSRNHGSVRFGNARVRALIRSRTPRQDHRNFLTVGEAKGLMGLKEWRIVRSSPGEVLGRALRRAGMDTVFDSWVGCGRDAGDAYHRGVLFHVCTSKSADGE